MKNPHAIKVIAAGVIVLALSSASFTNEVSILSANFHHSGADKWSVNITLEHADTGWEHFADSWRIVDGNGKILGERVLRHPHVDEQPFTRSLGVKIPVGTTSVFVEAHDKKHGWSSRRLSIDLTKASNGRLTVKQ